MEDERKQRERARLADARAVWEELAARASMIHCPVHFAQPWRVTVIGDQPERLRLQIYGCCSQLQVVIDEMIANDARASGLA